MQIYLNGFTELTPQNEDSTCYVLDTNYLLDSLSSLKFSNQYFNIIMENNSPVFIPFIVWVEFNYNVQKVLEKTETLIKVSNEYLEKYNSEKLEISTGLIKTKFDNLFDKKIIENNFVGQTISKEIKNYFDSMIDNDSDLINIIDSLNKKNKEILDSWKEKLQVDLNKNIREHIENTKALLINFKDQINTSETKIIIGEKYSQEDLKQKIQDCKFREQNNLLPGNSNDDLDKTKYKIWGDLVIPSKYGDMLFWLELIDFAKNNKEIKKFVIISNDIEKEDWVFKKSKKLFPQLLIEFFTKTSGSTIDHMTSHEFINKFYPETTHEDLQSDNILQLEDSVTMFEEAMFEEIEVEDEPMDDLFADLELEDYAYKDTIIVPAKRNGFKEVFLGENKWYSIYISKDRIPYLKYIAAYQSHPISKVTHIARIGKIEDSPYHSGKKMVIFNGTAKKLKRSIPLGDDYLALQGPRYTNHKKLNSASSTDDLFNFDNLFDDDL